MASVRYSGQSEVLRAERRYSQPFSHDPPRVIRYRLGRGPGGSFLGLCR